MVLEKVIKEGMGKAYAFFDSKTSPNKIREELNTVRRVIGVPSSLDLNYMTSVPELKLVAHAGRNNLYEARLPGYSNKDTAEVIAGTVNQLYNTEHYEPNEPFVGDIVHAEGDKYVYHD